MTSLEVVMSLVNLLTLIDLIERYDMLLSGGGGRGDMEREVNRGKWSEGETGEWVITGERRESLLVMTRSRMWL